jgi:two-component system, OmpR family, sensor histidine kinase CpxA
MYITRPVRQLADVVDRFGAGELTARAAPRSKDEIGNLGTSFNAMAKRIHTLLAAERQLLQDVSHELRSPLARLTFEAEMVRSTTDRDAAATRLRRDIERLSELVGTLIDMARAEGEPGEVEMEALCLNDLLLITAEDSELEAQAAGCSINVKAPQEINLQGNAELLRRAIENVLRNAIRYAPPESVVEVGLEREANCARITVRDYGPGIPEKFTERIFDPFFRVDSSRDERTGGLGLGLAIARRAVRVHHGDITAVNASPGALLTVTLPLRPDAR